jgi:hypothetical protein
MSWLSVALVLLLLWAVVLHQKLLVGLGFKVRLIHFLLLSIMGGLLWPVVRGWERKVEVPVEEHQLGVILWDASSSMGKNPSIKEEWKSALEANAHGQLEWMEFSENLLPPWGEGTASQGTSLQGALVDLEDNLAKLAPDWIWLISDMGFQPPREMTEVLTDMKGYLTRLEVTPSTGGDIGIEDVVRDPVWYARTSSPVRVRLRRDQLEEATEVDLLFHLNGELVTTARGRFEKGSHQADVVVDLQAKEVGPILLEINIAEGQGGARLENDHWLDEIESLRDRIRILRVVGRPNWSSKYLRDALVKREDVDLVDFHILRSMSDMVMAAPNDLALIPFPVEELFVENIDSFDLVLWQNFNQDEYPFFRPAYLNNIRREVKSGTGLLLWSGTLPWRLDRGPLRELAPLVTTGKDHQEVKGSLLSSLGELGWPDALSFSLENLPPRSYRVFKGKLQDDARVALSVKDTPLITLKKFGKGRVAQVLSDSLWSWSFSDEASSHDLYDEVLGRLLLWLQQHPDVENKVMEAPLLVRSGKQVTVRLRQPLGKNSRALWTSRNGKTFSGKEDLLQGEESLKLEAPPEPGFYRLGLEGTDFEVEIGVRGLQDEFWSLARCEKTAAELIQSGWRPLKKGGRPDWLDGGRSQVLERDSGWPLYRHPIYAAIWLILLIGHWVITNRILLRREKGTRLR